MRMTYDLADRHKLLLVAEIDGRLVGYLQAAFDVQNQCVRRVSLGVLAGYWAMA
jgi:hypothetical protein